MGCGAGWYCVGCEAYKDDSEMEGDHMCPTHKKRCVERQEENYFFALSKYQSQIEVRLLLRKASHEKVNCHSYAPCADASALCSRLQIRPDGGICTYSPHMDVVALI